MKGKDGQESFVAVKKLKKQDQNGSAVRFYPSSTSFLFLVLANDMR
jgi:hypothetical protein